MQSFNVLDRSLDILGNHFLEASAGTGKTFAIEHLFVRFLLDENSTFSIDQILVVTFTRAAARELKMRIRTSLERALYHLCLGEGGPDYLLPWFERGVAAPKKKIEEALASFEEAHIFTIHSFCHRILSEFAFETKSGFSLPDAESRDYRPHLRQTLRDFFYTELHSDHYSAHQLSKVLKRYQNRVERFEEALISLVEREGEFSRPPSFREYVDSFNKELAAFPKLEAEKILSDFAALSPIYKKMGHPQVLKEVQQIALILEKRRCAPEEFEELSLEEECFLERWREGNLKIRAKRPQELFYPDIFDTMRLKLYPLIRDAKDPTKILLRIAHQCRERWMENSLYHEKLSPDGILRRVENCLTNPAFSMQVREKYRIAIIDEFQDTDPRQWRIFHHLFFSESHPMKALYLVGDPKQSIYSFRSADLYTYLEAARIVGGEQRASLDVNFRSDPHLIESLNAFFSSVNWIELPALGETRPYLAIRACERVTNFERDDGRGALHFSIVETRRGREKSWPSLEIEEEILFPSIAEEIKGLLPSKIAVLVKDRYQAKRLQHFLKKWKIAACVKRGESLRESPALLAVEELLIAIENPGDLGFVRRALGGVLVGWSCSELLDVERVREVQALFYRWRTTLWERGFGALIEEFFGSDLYANNAIRGEDLSLYHQLRYLITLLIGEPPSDLLTLLKKIKTSKDEEIPPLHDSEEEEGVFIMTIHVSKGLEFDHVFCLGLASRHSQEEEVVRLKDQLIPFERENPLCQQAIQEREAEKMRQLYVALTRAKRRVYVPLLIDLDQKPVPLGHGAPIELFLERALKAPLDRSSLLTFFDSLRAHHVTYAFAEREGRSSQPEESQRPISLKPPPPLAHPFASESLLSFSSMTHTQSAPLNFVSGEERNRHTLPLGTETGSILHRIFEHLLCKPEKSLEQLVHHEVKRSVLEGWEEIVIEVIEKAWCTPLFKGGFALADLSTVHILQEMEFLFSTSSGYIKGFTDLCFEHEGKYYLLDWKSNWLGPTDDHYTQERLAEAMRDNDYFLQASIYTVALTRYVKLFDTSLEFGGAFYYFLRGHAIYHFFPKSIGDF
jgi:exodeoxyribonuclease V beta subunit